MAITLISQGAGAHRRTAAFKAECNADSNPQTGDAKQSDTRGEVLTGSLTIYSPLAGATELPLAGRFIVPPLLLVERELSFGRMLRERLARARSRSQTTVTRRCSRPPSS